VDINDVVFAVHAFALSSVQLMQTFIYYRGKEKTKFATWAIIIAVLLVITVTIMFILNVSGVKIPVNAGTIRMFGYSKAVITFVKYLPQVYLNWSRKSTVGWSIGNVILDFTGGSFSLAQEIIDQYANGKPMFSGDGFNIVKFMLSIMSMFFDMIFLFQRYVLYPDAHKKDAALTKMKENVSC
jgi:cystinosin